ncbi:MAG TPA: signal peptidase I [Longimicrobiales bacterium]|nr:signal peptidase I [Longimicrobiales bacterium]
MAREQKTRQTSARQANTRQAKQAEEHGAGQVAWEWLKSGIIGFLIFIVVRTFLIQTFTIVSGSMEGTLLVGDFLVLNKSAYGATVPGTDMRLPGYDEPGRGDIIVFEGHHEPIDLVKRLIGMPGDTLAMIDGVLYLNGEPQEEPYAHHTLPERDTGHLWMEWQEEHLVDSARDGIYRPTRDNWGPIVVPENRYFVLGDNRDESLDSRYWGFIQPGQVKGRAVALYFSYDNSRSGGMPVLGRVRWNRIGDRLR